jgi:hypothetical protein
MAVSTKFVRIALTVLLFGAPALAADNFSWDWRNQQVVGRDDPSVANTSKLKEPDRAALIDAIAARLQKPMSEHGYSDDRIREVAAITRVRFIDLGKGPVVLAASISMEGGCDGSNCPFWIFQNSPDGYVSLLDTVAASYTVQPDSTNGFFDLVTMRHVSSNQSLLTLYRYQDNKYVDSGCYTATSTPPKEGEVPEPDVAPCKTDKPESK